jgi:6-phosphogluconolactonase/glucosamine-6-phosphate isomerase/deaminase
VLKKINEQMSSLTQKCQIRKFYFNQPIEGVVEVTVTLRVIDRVRSLILRFEGVDKRWICTELTLL